MDNVKNFSYSAVLTAPTPAISGDDLVLESGGGDLFPPAPFNAVVWPSGMLPLASNAEIVRVITVVGDTFTITRAQEGSAARTILVGDQIAAAVTKKILDDLNNPIAANILAGTAGINITGNAGTAEALLTGRTINGVTFDGTGNITVPAAAGTLTGATLASGVLASSLTSVGVLTGGSTGAGFTVALTTSTITGTLEDSRLSSNVPLKDAANSFTAAQTIGTTTNVAQLQILPTHATYTSSAIYVNTTRAANAAFNLLSLNANNANKFLVDGIGSLSWGGGSFISSSSDVGLASALTTHAALTTAHGAVSANTVNTIVLRDASGNFSAGTISAALTGNASTATALQTPRAINGVNFDGTAAITVPAAAGTLTGATLASGVTASSLTSVGTLTGGATGAGFTVALNVSTITGTLADARLSANVPLLNAANAFTSVGITSFVGNVGIGTTTPDAPLAFSTAVGDKIQLYDNGGAATYGFGLQSNNLQILVPSSSQDITFGYGLSASQTVIGRISAVSGVASQLTMTNATAGAGNYAAINAVADAGLSLVLRQHSSTFTTSGVYIQGGATVEANYSGGLALAATSASGVIRFFAGGTTEVGRIVSTNWFIGDTSNANMTQGLTINQGENDNEILALKSSDIAHGMTGIKETDTFASISKEYPGTGGMGISGLSEDTVGVAINGYATIANTTKSTGALANIIVYAWLKSGTGSTVHGSNENLFAVSNGATVKFLVDAEGDVHYDGTTNASAWDDYDDIALLEGLRVITAQPNFKHRFARNIQDSADVLVRTGVLTWNADGRHFVSTKGLAGLTIDAIRQLGMRMNRLEERLLT